MNGLCGGSGEVYVCEQGGNQYFFYCYFFEKY